MIKVWKADGMRKLVAQNAHSGNAEINRIHQAVGKLNIVGADNFVIDIYGVNSQRKIVQIPLLRPEHASPNRIGITLHHEDHIVHKAISVAINVQT